LNTGLGARRQSVRQASTAAGRVLPLARAGERALPGASGQLHQNLAERRLWRLWQVLRARPHTWPDLKRAPVRKRWSRSNLTVVSCAGRSCPTTPRNAICIPHVATFMRTFQVDFSAPPPAYATERMSAIARSSGVSTPTSFDNSTPPPESHRITCLILPCIWGFGDGRSETASDAWPHLPSSLTSRPRLLP